MALSAEPPEAIEQKEVVTLQAEIVKMKRERWLLGSLSAILGLVMGLLVGAFAE